MSGPPDIARVARRVAREVRARLDVVSRELGGREDLGGLCHFAALGLMHAMIHEGVPAAIVSDGAHSWVHVDVDAGEMMVDVTASQYGFAPVLVRMPSEARPRWRRTGSRHRELYYVAVRELEAQKLCQGVADKTVFRPPPLWWMTDVDDLPLSLLCARTYLHCRNRVRPCVEYEDG